MLHHGVSQTPEVFDASFHVKFCSILSISSTILLLVLCLND